MSDIQKIYKYLDQAGTYYLATVDRDRPVNRPFSTVFIYEDKLYILTGKKKDVYEQLQRNPHVDIAVMAHDNSTWIHLTGELKEDTRPEPLELMSKKYPDFVKKYNQDITSENAVFYFTSGQAIVSSWRTEPITWTL